MNVAITRARNQVIMFSSIKAEHVDLARTRSLGVRHLKSFLDYADRGPRAIAEAITLDPDADFDSPFEQAVYRALVDLGHEVDLQVGCSGYRIDLAVKDPDRPGEYLLGVECDGAFYHSGKTARDRDRLRQDVLESLGWCLHRIWSTDWRLNRNKVVQRLTSAITEASRARRRGNGIDSKPAVAASMEAQSGPPAPPLSGASSVVPVTAPLFPEAPERPLPPEASVYVPFDVSVLEGTAAEFYEPASTRKLATTLRRIVEQEGPIRLEVAARRVAGLWGLERVTNRVEARIADVHAADTTKSRPQLIDGILWSSRQVPQHYTGFRVAGGGEASWRRPEDIPPIEIANALRTVLRQQISLPAADLEREGARMLGFQRVTQRMQEVMRQGVAMLLQQGIGVETNGAIALAR